jgi:hypothetical protein
MLKLFDKFIVENIDDGIFVVKNFISENECQNIVDMLQDEKYKIRRDNMLACELSDKTLFYSNFIENKIAENIGPNLLIKQGGFNCILQGNTMTGHTDLDGFDHRSFSKKYGVVLYLNNFIGGQVRYPKLNISYQPSAGDFLMHKPHILHEVLEVKSHNRYTYTSYVWSQKNVV